MCSHCRCAADTHATGVALGCKRVDRSDNNAVMVARELRVREVMTLPAKMQFAGDNLWETRLPSSSIDPEDATTFPSPPAKVATAMRKLEADAKGQRSFKAIASKLIR